uniref:Outer membrane protein (Tpn50) n=1 Tax=uncultured bacterium contig00051 TaxID=1181535 RepID=A0A806K2D1_9BACT|nr:outer membrane protein (tpn50) [uncultured bacterium contig00051]
METLLESNAVTYARASWFVLNASYEGAASAESAVSQKPEISGYGEAFSYALSQGWLPKNAQADGEARLDGVSLLCMNVFGIKGGIMYSIAKSPHYAFREMQYHNIIAGPAAPNQKVSGEQLLSMISRLLSYMENSASEAAEKERLALEAAAHRKKLAEEINALLRRHHVADTVAEETDEGITITLSNIRFIADSSVLPDAEKEKLAEIAGILKNLPDVKLLVTGHSALAGTAEDQLIISRERAEAVASYLVLMGACKEENISAVGMGAERPIADNSSQEGMSANRRVEITILEN